MEIQLGAPATSSGTPLSYRRAQDMIDHINFKWMINQARRRNSNNAITALLSISAFVEKHFPQRPWPWYKKILKPYYRLYYRFMDKFFPVPLEDITCR